MQAGSPTHLQTVHQHGLCPSGPMERSTLQAWTLRDPRGQSRATYCSPMEVFHFADGNDENAAFFLPSSITGLLGDYAGIVPKD